MVLKLFWCTAVIDKSFHFVLAPQSFSEAMFHFDMPKLKLREQSIHVRMFIQSQAAAVGIIRYVERFLADGRLGVRIPAATDLSR